ncbi:MAG TPA: 4Fe-4S dicluster domain-containing protein [Chloroflexota bacterium]|nr:4Fe-4S dicluster domain-containing protein [Chloroflexota bacterium]HUM70104.1 4Fe-4S dicluster domain-containing protein [Chloroflexota bacterium]
MSTQQFPTETWTPANFLERVMAATPGESRLEMCIQCGTCGGSCPSGDDMDNTPRQIFAMIRAGMEEEVLASNTPWYCVSCYYCAIRCPQEVHIPDIMYTLKNMAIAQERYVDSVAPDWSQTFVDYVENYGRSFEFGLATRHFLRHRPTGLRDTAQMGLGLLTKGRMDLSPQKIEQMPQLQAILNRAKEVEATL